MGQACHPSYSGGRDQENRQFEASPQQAVCKTLSQTKTNKQKNNTKKGW
jgi:hypothetical protein